MTDCVFCKIIGKEMPSTTVYEDDSCVVIKDILPKAPVHLLVLSREHIGSVVDLKKDHEALVGHMVFTAKEIAAQQGIAETGYKLIFNVGKDGGQIIDHIHLHLLGGKKLGE